MPSVFQFLPMIVTQVSGSQQLGREPEPTQLTDQTENVEEYDRVLTTPLVLTYLHGLQIIHQARSEGSRGLAVDLACGPGYFTLFLAQYLDYQRVVGIDLSQPMVQTASKNAERLNRQDRVSFRVGDVTQLRDIEAGEADLTTFTAAAHHMPDLSTVAGVLAEMDRITKPDGLIMLMDLVRLRTAKLTEKYVQTLGHDFVARGMPHYFDDFRNSMFAAWTARELRETIPRKTDRYWCHIVPHGLPTVQVILGLPVGRKQVFLRSGFPWPASEDPVPADLRQEWRMMRLTFWGASRKIIPPGGGE